VDADADADVDEAVGEVNDVGVNICVEFDVDNIYGRSYE
jgi:hypothetical protein